MTALTCGPRKWAIFLLSVVASLPAIAAVHAQSSSISAWEAADFRSWSFIPNWTSQTHVNTFRTDRVYDHVSDVLYSFGVQPRADGSLYYRPEAANHLARLKSDQEMFGFRYHMCMFTVNGGDTQTVWETITASPSIRATFTNNVENLMLANNMTGFNLDWERPNTATEWGNYTQLAKEMQTAFPAEWEVSVDDYGFADSRWNDSPLFDPNAFDQVGLMAYHYAASSQNTFINGHTALGFDESQLILGMGTWGQTGPATLPLKNLVAVDPNLAADATSWSGTAVDVNGVTRTGTWDIVSRYEVRDNVQLALDRGLAGVMWWTLSYDATNKMSLARVAQQYAMFKRSVPDLNLDGKVNASDANDLADNMGSALVRTGTTTAAQVESFYMSGNWEKGDRDGNGYVNQADADWLAGRYAGLNVALPDRLAYTGSFEKFSNSLGVDGRWEARRNRFNQLIETGNFTQHSPGTLAFVGTGVGAGKFSSGSVTLRNQNSAEVADGVNGDLREMRGELSTPLDLAQDQETYLTFVVRQNSAGLLPSQVSSPNRTLSLEMLDAAGLNQFDFTLFGQQTDFGIRSQTDAAGQDVTAEGFAADATHLFVAKISGNGAGLNTMQASLFAPGSAVGNFTDPHFSWMLTAQSSEGFNPVITDLQFTSQTQGNFTVSNVWTGVASDFFAAPAPGDFNADGVVDAADLERWKTGVGTTAAATHWDGDADGDQDVDGADLLVWQRRLGSVTPGATATASVPEPSGMLVALLALGGVAATRRR
jgi:MYXO-CTERM domain-containing protein